MWLPRESHATCKGSRPASTLHHGLRGFALLSSGGYVRLRVAGEQGIENLCCAKDRVALLGHSTLLMTQRYLNVSDDELATAMSEKMWKRA